MKTLRGTKVKICMPILILLIQVVFPMINIINKNILTLTVKANTENIYYINTAQDLWDFAKEVNEGNTFKGRTVYLTKDIVLECNQNNQWIPIGWCSVDSGNNVSNATDKAVFKGVFEGNNHIISGIYIYTDKNYAGLFGLNSGTINNLILKDSTIESTKAYIGGIVAYNEGTIENCHNYANIIPNTNSGACGGIAGYSTGANILNCSNHQEIKGSNGFIAGITGYSWSTNIENCYNEGNIKNSYAAAGICGYSQTSWINKCYNKRRNCSR